MAVRLFVGNLSYTTTEADLRTYFGAVAAPSHVVLPVDRDTGRPRGFAFVEFPERAQAEEVIQKFNGQILNGRAISVSEARAREDRGPAGPRPGGPAGPRPGGAGLRPGPPYGPRSVDLPPSAAPRSRNFGPDAKPLRGGQKLKKRDEQKPRGPIPVRGGSRSFSLEDDSPDQTPPDFDDIATSKPHTEEDEDEK